MTEKEIAVAFLNGVITDNVHDMYEQFTADNFVHHNPFYAHDKQSILTGMIEANVQFPHKQLTVKRIVSEPPEIAVFSHLALNDAMELAVVHIFRFENGKIAELWDIAQEIPQKHG